MHFSFKRSNDKGKTGYPLGIVLIVIIAVVIFVIVIDLPEFLTIILGTTVTIPFLSNMDFKDKLNAFLTFLIAIFTIIASYSAYLQFETGQEKRKVDIARNELEKLYGPIYSILSNVVFSEENKAILTQNERKMVDETFSRQPFILTSQEEWKLKMHNDETSNIYQKFIENFNNEYQSKKGKDEIQRQFSAINSLLNNAPRSVSNVAIILPSEKMTIDKRFSTYPFMNKQLYDLWNKEIRPLELTIGYRAIEHRFTLCENLKIEPNQIPTMQGVYLIPKEFVLKFIETYDAKVSEYRKMSSS